MVIGTRLRIELYLFACALFPAVLYLLTHDLRTALYVFLVCFGVPQPFLLSSRRSQSFGKRRR